MVLYTFIDWDMGAKKKQFLSFCLNLIEGNTCIYIYIYQVLYVALAHKKMTCGTSHVKSRVMLSHVVASDKEIYMKSSY